MSPTASGGQFATPPPTLGRSSFSAPLTSPPARSATVLPLPLVTTKTVTQQVTVGKAHAACAVHERSLTKATSRQGVCSLPVLHLLWTAMDILPVHAICHLVNCKMTVPYGQVVLGAPECLSYTFNEEGKVTSFTGGYIMDRCGVQSKTPLRMGA